MSDEEKERVEEQEQQAPQNDDFAESDSEGELSELDEEQFKDVDYDEIGLGEEVFSLKRHKRSNDSAATTTASQPKRSRQPKKRVRKADSEEPEPEIRPEWERRRLLEERIDAALKPNGKKKKRKLDDVDLEQLQDEKLSELRDEMRQAAIADAEAVRDGQAATNKLKLLPKVRDLLRRQNLADSVLDNNLLEAVRMWLEPLPDASLPAYAIQKELFAILESLPIKTIHLRESGIGKIMIFYQRSKRPPLAIKHTADRLVGKWSRPIIGRSDNYKDKIIATASYNPDRFAGLEEDVADDSGEAIRRKNRAAIPLATASTFTVAPKSSVHSMDMEPGSSANSDSQYRRLKQMMTSASRSKTKKSGVSIEGRDLN
ncbi:hypothetical protein CANCADRAFT_38619 [Tortispora caseinolytica NRRL Y-17796]|uniref:TFIIS N-terminal domain-containing protein n=1 Tax=Tortispora caseinolytica NRRL Y-17796 TaxID=767744 RepID=A0A1E4THD7_9ASCO|nr:hypothetical protein CANCADRAFT_38619 [Tortispora caseinolytica NRRL Y-17796]